MPAKVEAAAEPTQTQGASQSTAAAEAPNSLGQVLWHEAWRSIQAGLLILAGAAAVLGFYIWRMPPLQVCLLARSCTLHRPLRGARSCSVEGLGLGLTLTTMHCPSCAQAHELAALMANFPPRSLTSVITVRDTLLSYAESYPVSRSVLGQQYNSEVGVVGNTHLGVLVLQG